MLCTSPTTRNVSVLTKRSMSWRLSTVRSSLKMISAMCFTSVSSAYPNAIISTSGGKNMKNNVIGSRQTTMNSLNKIAPSPRKGLRFIYSSVRSSREKRGTSHPLKTIGDKSAISGLVFRPTRFFTAPPALNLFFARDRLPRIIQILVVNQSIYFVFFCEAFDLAVLVFPYAPNQAVCDARVEKDPAAIRHHVNEEGFHFFVRFLAPL